MNDHMAGYRVNLICETSGRRMDFKDFLFHEQPEAKKLADERFSKWSKTNPHDLIEITQLWYTTIIVERGSA